VVIIFCLGAFLFVKIEFRHPNSSHVMWLYGIAVTSVVFTQMYVGLIRYRDPARGHVAPNDQQDQLASTTPLPSPLVSCLVAVHNEAGIIDRCIRSLAEQSYHAIEIIVVDDASTDDTRARLHELAGLYPIRVVELDRNVGKKRALGAGILLATGDIFAFTDSDSTWAPDAIEKAVGLLGRNPSVGAVSGHCRASNANDSLLTKMQDSWYEGQFSVRKAFESAFGAVTCVSGPLAIFRREAIYNYIPAWEQDTFLGSEFRFATDRTLTGYVLMDERTASRVRRHNAGTPFASPAYPPARWDIVYSKSIRATTVVPNTLSALMRQQVRWKKSFFRNIFFTGRFYWRRPLIPALTYYFHIFFVFAGPLVAFRHILYLPLHGNVESMILYVAGILLIGTFFGLAFRGEDPNTAERWLYRPLMSLFSTLVLSWLIAYSVVTIKNMRWARG
jgi:cellulose synthase/poly-beta-1,6-N-acetylglucosamine synthase-like glycosyltransferase